jgi:hypothetical protein
LPKLQFQLFHASIVLILIEFALWLSAELYSENLQNKSAPECFRFIAQFYFHWTCQKFSPETCAIYWSKCFCGWRRTNFDYTLFCLRLMWSGLRIINQMNVDEFFFADHKATTRPAHYDSPRITNICWQFFLSIVGLTRQRKYDFVEEWTECMEMWEGCLRLSAVNDVANIF